MYTYPKKILTIHEQIKNLNNSGININSYNNAENILKSIGFYRLRGYSYHLYDTNTKKYIPGTTFELITNIYYFDQSLSSLVLSILLKIEVALRARLIDALLIHNDPLILQDASIFKNKQLYWTHMATISTEISRSQEIFIKHNFDNYDGIIPVWAAIEVISFGTLSKIIKNLKTGPHSSYSVLAKHYGFYSQKNKFVVPSNKLLSSWLHSVCVLRNLCAHNSRLYNKTICTFPEILEADKTYPHPCHNGLYQVLLAMKYLRPNNEEWNKFVFELESLINHNSKVINLKNMNFPYDWKEHLYI